MSDNYTTNAASGGSTFASDEIATVQHPRVKVEWGVDGTVNDASASAPLPTSSAAESSQMTILGVPVTPLFAAIDATTNPDNTIVAAVVAKKIRVLAAFLVAAGTTTVRFESGAGGGALTGQMNLVANTGFVLPFNPAGWFETGVNTLLNLELSAAVSVDGSLTYITV